MVIPAEGTRRLTSHWKSGFYHIARKAGVPPPDASDIRFVGDDPIYPSPLPLGRGAATALAMIAAQMLLMRLVTALAG